MKFLFIVAKGNRKMVRADWEKGKPFPTVDERTFVSKNNIEKLRGSYERIILQYDSGTIEV